MNSIENLPSFENEKNDKNNNNNNSYLNILIKTLIFTLSGKISMLENQMNKITKFPLIVLSQINIPIKKY